MDKSAMFEGLNKEEWTEALSEQREYIKDNYDYDIMEGKDLEADRMNEMAKESQSFIKTLADGLKNGVKAGDDKIQAEIKKHLEFLNEHGVSTDAKSFLRQTKFFLEDDFHRNMFENEQVGLSYYLAAAAEAYAGK